MPPIDIIRSAKAVSVGCCFEKIINKAARLPYTYLQAKVLVLAD